MIAEESLPVMSDVPPLGAIPAAWETQWEIR